MTEYINISISQTLYRRARKLAHARNQPIDDVLADVLDGALPLNDEPDTVDEDGALEREMQTYIGMHAALTEKYLGQHVAVLDEQLIDVDPEYDALYERIDAQYPDQFVWLTKVEVEPIPTLIFRSPRFMPNE